MHFGAQREPKRRFPGSHFEANSRLVAKVKMKLPFEQEHHFQGSRASKKRWMSTQFLEGVLRSSRITFCNVFEDFGCPLGIQMDCILEIMSTFFDDQNFNDFGGLRPSYGCRGRRQRGCPPDGSRTCKSLRILL